jgi:hypothetical protein
MVLAAGTCCYNMKIFKLFLCIDVYGFSLLVNLLNLFSNSFYILVPAPYMHYHNLYFIFSSYFPLIDSDLIYIYIYIYIGVTVLILTWVGLRKS